MWCPQGDPGTLSEKSAKLQRSNSKDAAMFPHSQQCLPPGWPCHCERFVCQENWGEYLEHSGTLCSQISKDKKQVAFQQQVQPLLKTGCIFPEESHLWRSCSWRCLHQATKPLQQLDLVSFFNPLTTSCCKIWQNNPRATKPNGLALTKPLLNFQKCFLQNGSSVSFPQSPHQSQC